MLKELDIHDPEKQELFDYLDDFETRHAYVDSTIRQLLPAQIRATRVARKYDQSKLGERADGMKQPSIARLEDPNYASMTIKTLKRICKALDIALLVDMVSFGEFVERTIDRRQEDFAPPDYGREKELRRKEWLKQDAIAAEIDQANHNEGLLRLSIASGTEQEGGGDESA